MSDEKNAQTYTWACPECNSHDYLVCNSDCEHGSDRQEAVPCSDAECGECGWAGKMGVGIRNKCTRCKGKGWVESGGAS